MRGEPSPYLPPALVWDDEPDDTPEPEPEWLTVAAGIVRWHAGPTDDDD